MPRRRRPGRASCRSRPTRSTARSTRATPTEDAPLAPRSPYAAAKAAGELLVRSYVVTHGLDAVVTRGSNTYGPYHHPEKLIPLFVTNALDDRPLPLYGDGLQRRDWLYVSDHAAAIDFVLRHGATGETYNVAGRDRADEPRGRDAPARAARASRGRWSARSRTGPATTGATRWTARSSRRSAGARRPAFEDGLAATVDWYRANEAWWRADPVGRLGRLVRAPVRAAARDRPGGAGHARDRRLMRVAVTGAGGRLGRALVAALADAPFTGPAGPIAWDRDAFDLDAPDGIGARLDARPTRGRRPRRGLDRRRRLRPRPGARAAPQRGRDRRPRRRPARRAAIDLLVDLDQRGLRRHAARRRRLPARPTRSSPANPYGASKAAGERLAAAAFAARPGAALGIARTAWLFGAPGRDFPSRILDAAERAAAAGEPLRVVSDEWGTPTYTADVADAIVELLAEDATAGIHHLVNGLFATRADWARYVVGRAGIEVDIVDVPASTWERPSRPPRWGVLAPTPLPSGEPMRVVARRDGRLRAGAPARDGGSGHDAGRRRRPRSADRRCPASATARSPATATRAARSASCGAPGQFPGATFVQANLSTSAAGRPARPPPPPPPGRPLGRRRRAGRSSRSSTSGRRSPATAPAGRRDPRARRPTTGSTSRPASPTASSPSSRSSCVYLVTNEYDGSDELGFAWDDPAVGGPLARRSRRPPDGRPILSDRDAANPSLADLVVRLRHDPL